MTISKMTKGVLKEEVTDLVNDLKLEKAKLAATKARYDTISKERSIILANIDTIKNKINSIRSDLDTIGG